MDALLAELDAWLAAPVVAPTPRDDYGRRHLAKAVGTARAARLLINAGMDGDAAVLVRTVIEQLFTYMWVVQDPARAPIRGAMVDLKQAWANAQYLDAMAREAGEDDAATLRAEAAGSRAEAEALLARLAEELGTTPKKVRDEATMRSSLKAIEVNLGPRFGIPFARYSGFAHSDGHALAGYAARTPEGTVYGRGAPEGGPLPLEADLAHALARLAAEVRGT